MLLEKLQAKKVNFAAQKENFVAKKKENKTVMTTVFEAGVKDYRKMAIHARLTARHAAKTVGYGTSGTVHMAKAAAAAPGAATEAAAKKVNDYIFAFEAWKANGNIRKYKEYKLLFESSAMLGEIIYNGLSLLEKEETVAQTAASSQAIKAWELLCAKYGVERATTWIQQNPEMWEMMKGGEK